MLYIILPIYNEEQNIISLLAQLQTALLNQDYKIIIVNDGSTDNSLKLVESLKNSKIIIETYHINMNIGSVFSTGIDRALLESKNRNDIIIIMESDQTSEVEFIDPLIAEINVKNNDVAIASRYRNGGKYVNFPLKRKIFSSSANRLMKYFFPIAGVNDYTIFFRAYRADIISKAIKHFGKFGLIQSKGFVANAELLVKLSFFTNKVSEIPFIYNYKNKLGKSKINILRTINEYLVLIFYLKRIVNKFNNFQFINNPKEGQI